MKLLFCASCLLLLSAPPALASEYLRSQALKFGSGYCAMRNQGYSQDEAMVTGLIALNANPATYGDRRFERFAVLAANVVASICPQWLSR